MASKKCPKCGEDNPAEAVMCWACYTPLSGSAPLGAGLAAGVAASTMPKTAGAPVGVPASNEEPAKKGVDPKMIGVGAFLLVGAVAAVMMSGMMSGNGDGGAVTPETGVATIAEGGGAPASAPGVAPPPISAPVAAAAGAAVAPAPIPFKTIASPAGGSKTGTLGILVTGNAISPAGAAKFAKDQFAKNGSWTNMQVAVFTDQTSADAFGTYQRSRRNQPLTNADFRALANQGVWSSAPAYLDARGRSEKIYNPSRNPNGWWPGG